MTPSSTSTSCVQATPLRPRASLVTCTLWVPRRSVERRMIGGVRGRGGLGQGRVCIPEVAATAVLGQHVAAASLKVQQAAVEGAIVRVTKSHAGSWPGQATGTAAAGTQGWGLVLASAPDSVRQAGLAAPRSAHPTLQDTPGGRMGTASRQLPRRSGSEPAWPHPASLSDPYTR